MAQLLIDGEWFDAVSPGAWYESGYEDLLVQYAEQIFPDFFIVRFKKLVQSVDGMAKADLALIHRTFAGWYVVEVELGIHSLQHVTDQVLILSRASYGAEDAEHLIQRNPQLPSDRVRDLVRGAPPRVLVIVNESKPDWVHALRRWDVEVCTVEAFRSRRNRLVLRLNGVQPKLPGDIVSHCKRDPHMKAALVVASPAMLPVTPGAALSMLYAGGMTRWKRVDVGDRVWLMPSDRCPLDGSSVNFTIRRGADGGLLLEEGRR